MPADRYEMSSIVKRLKMEEKLERTERAIRSYQEHRRFVLEDEDTPAKRMEIGNNIFDSNVAAWLDAMIAAGSPGIGLLYEAGKGLFGQKTAKEVAGWGVWEKTHSHQMRYGDLERWTEEIFLLADGRFIEDGPPSSKTHFIGRSYCRTPYNGGGNIVPVERVYGRKDKIIVNLARIADRHQVEWSPKLGPDDSELKSTN